MSESPACILRDCVHLCPIAGDRPVRLLRGSGEALHVLELGGNEAPEEIRDRYQKRISGLRPDWKAPGFGGVDLHFFGLGNMKYRN